MADYFGRVAIAKRMGVDPSTLDGWHRRRGFLMYHRWNNQTFRYVWYSNDDLIKAWELAQCVNERRGPRPMDQAPKRESRWTPGGKRDKV